MKFIKYRCKECGTEFIATNNRHSIDSCKCGKGCVDFEDGYSRFTKELEFVQEFKPPWFDDEDEYHSALLSFLNDSDEEYRLSIYDGVLYVRRIGWVE